MQTLQQYKQWLEDEMNACIERLRVLGNDTSRGNLERRITRFREAGERYKELAAMMDPEALNQWNQSRRKAIIEIVSE